MNIFGTLKGIATELFDLDVPYNKHDYDRPFVAATSRDRNGYSVLHIYAHNYQDAASLTDGYTVEGPVHKSLTRVGHNQWEARVECNDTEVRR